MHEKRYSIFISSTFEDLKDERRAVQEVVISARDFPVQMESFPAADENQFEFIKALIDKCDYYVLIVAGRYGTPADSGMSYTEKEYRYAVSKKIPVLVMLHGDRGKIPSVNSEQSTEGKARLEAFVKEVQTNRLRKEWFTTDGLRLAVREALENAKATKPAIGWVRGDTIASVDALEELVEVRKENAKYRDAIGQLNIELALPPIPAGDEQVIVDLIPTSFKKFSSLISGTSASLAFTWLSAFPVFYSSIQWGTSDWNGEINHYLKEEESFYTIGEAFAAELATFDCEKLFRISKSTFDRLCSYYIEVGLMVTDGERPFTEQGQRFARRYHISGGHGARPVLVKGSLERIVISETLDLGDEVPF